jgi:predicted Zn-dependent protease
LKERQIEIEASIKKVFAQEEDLSQPIKAMAYFARSQLLQFQNKHVDADTDFKKAQQLDPQNPIFDYRRGVSLLALKKNSEALDALKRAASKAPNDPRYFKRLAEAQSATGDAAGAKASLERAQQLAPNDFEVKLLEGTRLRAQRQYDAAIAAYEGITRELGPEAFSRAQMGISQALRESGRPAKAVKQMMDYLSKLPSGTSKPLLAQSWCELGQAHEANKDSDGAMTAYQTGIDEYMYDPNCHYFYCRALGGGGEAKQQCELYVTLAPNGEHVADAKRRSGGGGAPKSTPE